MYKIIKLTNGVEIIGDILLNEADPSLVAIDKPMQINYRMFQNAAMPAISLIRYSLMADNEPVTFCMKDVMNVIEPKPLFVDYYKSTVDSAFEHYDYMIDRELKQAIMRQSAEDQVETHYTHLLNNFESETMN
jgi:hypothetical protein